MVKYIRLDFVHLENRFDDSIEVMIQNHVIMTIKTNKRFSINSKSFNNILDAEVMLTVHLVIEQL